VSKPSMYIYILSKKKSTTKQESRREKREREREKDTVIYMFLERGVTVPNLGIGACISPLLLCLVNKIVF
jgi:late competence protein required for DNA uptake (superfamily II DNA/RNA helicase)